VSSVIRTERLDLVLLPRPVLRALADGDRDAAAGLVAFELAEEGPALATLERRLAQLATDPRTAPWLLRAMVLRSERRMVGHINFHGPPGHPSLAGFAPLAVELGYGVVAAERRRGFAREAAQGLMRWAARKHGVPQFVVSISPDNAPSLALAAALGFSRAGEHVDEVDGLELVMVRDA
jgi:RimJ/RimL family protein N-acetyltransferase